MKKNTLKIILRIVVSIAVLAFLFSRINFGIFKDILSQFNPLFYILAICVLLAHQLVWAFAWKITLQEKNVTIAMKDIYRAVLTSYFFGSFLPSSVGPDLVLAFNIGKSLPEKQHAPSSLMFIRLMSLTATFLISGIILIFIAHTFALRQIMLLTWGILLTIWVCYWLAVHPLSRKFIQRIANQYHWLRFIYKILDSFSTLGQDKKVPVRVWFLALLMVFLKVSIDFTIALSLGIYIPYIWFLGLIPTVTVISLIPISIAGLGIREGAYVAVFANMGVPATASLAISLTIFSLNILLCLIGGLLYLIHGTHVKYNHS